jgi:phosphatidylglycerol:prolipoprotein diacylglycerol transferase
MSYNPIEFPGLGLGPFDPNPTAFTVFGFGIQWYGILFALGFLLAAIYSTWRAKSSGIKPETFTDALFFCVPAAILGARLYYVVFNFSAFKGDLIKIFYIREGGVAIYGSIIFALLTAYIFCRIRKISVRKMFDLGALGFLIGQSIGRWGNYFNREVFGLETALPWRMELYSWQDGMRIQVHPTFFYESLWNAIGFAILHFFYPRRKYDGQIFLCYIAWYGLGRGIIEGMRADTLFLFNTGLMVSQLVAFVSFAAATGLLVFYELKRKKAEILPEENEI